MAERCTEPFYYRRLLGTLGQWRDEAIVDALTEQRLRAWTEQQLAALEAPRLAAVAPPPRAALPQATPIPTPARAPEPPPPDAPLPPPAPPRAASSGMGALLRERVGWAVGALLTGAGSLYLAGTVWGDLSSTWRSALVALVVGVYSLGLAALGSRLGSGPASDRGRRWTAGVALALLPVQTVALAGVVGPRPWVAAAAWPAVAALQHLLARRLTPVAIPGATRPLAAAMTVTSASLVFAGATSGPQWAALPLAGALFGLWHTGTRAARLPRAALALVGWLTAVHAVVGAQGPASGYAPLVAMAAAVALWVDARAATWKGAPRVQQHGLPGAIALALCLGALALVITSMRPLPAGVASLGAAALVGGLLTAAAVAHRRPPVLHVALLTWLLALLALPDVAHVVVDPLRAGAETALGYTQEPLPLAWYALTLAPYTAAIVAAAMHLPGSGLRQGRELARHALVFAGVLSVALIGAAHSHAVDLRPAVLAVPLYATGWAWWARRSGQAQLFDALVGVGAVLWAVDLGALLAPGGGATGAAVRAGLLVALVGAVALRGTAGARRAAALAAPLLVVTGVAWPTMLGLCGAWWALSRRVDGVEGGVVRAVALVALAAGAVGLFDATRPSELALAWWACGAGAALTAIGVWRRDDAGRWRGFAVAIAAHLALAATALARLTVDDPHRAALGAALLACLTAWAWRTRHPAYGALIGLGLAEAPARRLLHSDLTVALLVGATAAWLPALAARLTRPTAWWVHAIARPAWFAGACVALCAGLIAVSGATSAVGGALALAGAAALAGHAGRGLGLVRWPARSVTALAGLAGAAAALHAPLVACGLVVAAAAVGGRRSAAALALGAATFALLAPTSLGTAAIWATVAAAAFARRVQDPGRHTVATAVLGVAAAVAAVHALLDPGWLGLLGAATTATASLALVGVVARSHTAQRVAAAAADGLFALWFAALPAFVLLDAPQHWLAIGAAHTALAGALGRPRVARALGTGVLLTTAAALGAPTALAALAVAGWYLLTPWGTSRTASERWGTLGLAAALGAWALLSDGQLALLGSPVLALCGVLAARDLGQRGVARLAVGLAIALCAVPLGLPAWTAAAAGAQAWAAMSAAHGQTDEERLAWVVALAAAGSHCALGGPPLAAAGVAALGLARAVLDRRAALLGGSTLVALALLAAYAPDGPVLASLAAGAASVALWGAARSERARPLQAALPWIAAAGVAAWVGATVQGAPRIPLAAANALLVAALAARQDRNAAALVAGAGAALLGHDALGPAWCVALPGAVAIAADHLAARRAAWVLRASALGLGLAFLAGPADGVWISLGALGAAEALAARTTRGAPWWALVLGASAYTAARLHGPLEGLQADREPVRAAIIGLVAYGGSLAAARAGSRRWETALSAASWIGPLIALAATAAVAHLTGPALLTVGALLLARHAASGRPADLLTGLALADAGVLVTLLAAQDPDPVALTAPVALSVLVAAQRLRSSLDPRLHAALRWAAAGSVYLAAFGQNLVDPRDAALLATLGVLGVAAGAILRVRAYTFLGAGAVAAAALTPLVRFGLTDGRLWAVYLTCLGVVVLGCMALLAAHGARLRAVSARIAAWFDGMEG